MPEGRRFVLDYVDVSARSKARSYEPVAVWQNLKQSYVTKEAPVTKGLNVRAGAFKNLSGAASLAERVSQVELLAYIERVEAALSAAMSEESDSFVLELELKIMPDQVNVRTFSNI